MRARDNPFRTDRVLTIRYRMIDGSFPGMMDRLAELGYRGAIIGPKGAGKTTLLEDLEPALTALDFNITRLRLDDLQRSFPPAFLENFFDGLSARDFVLFDGAERLSRLAWLRFKRKTKKAGGLIVTSHRAGLLPTLKECRTTPEVLAEILEKLAGTPPAEKEVLLLYKRHKGNLREALREMYDIYSAKGEREC
jgi:hypothetical protein